MIPPDLIPDAIALVKHYDAWMTEYERVQREKDTPHVFVGIGENAIPFPRESEQRFRDRYVQLVQGSGI